MVEDYSGACQREREREREVRRKKKKKAQKKPHRPGFEPTDSASTAECAIR